MADCYKTVYEGGSGEITEKKSRFIATLCHIDSEEDAITFIDSMKKKYWDARHNCSAFVLGTRREVTRCSDDGEPGGTAGRPMLDVLLGEDLYDTAVVVTRYFGGTLLGTGGLVRAYSGAVREGLSHCKVIERKKGLLLRIETDYHWAGKLQYFFAQREIPVVSSAYTEQVSFDFVIETGRRAEIDKALTELSGGQCQANDIREMYFASCDGEILLDV